MELKILHSADLHLDSPFGQFPEDVRRELRQSLRSVPERLLQVSREEKCDLWLLAGDLFDGEVTWESYRALYRVLADCGVPVFIAPGNHDYYGVHSVWTEKSWPENVHIFDGSLSCVELPELGCRVYGAGYRTMDCEPLLQGFRAKEDGMYNLCVLHGDPVSGQSHYCPVTREQAASSELDYLALGHVHASGYFRAGRTLCGWPGCPMGRGWDETGKKGLFVVTLDETARIRQIPLELPGFFEWSVDASEGAAAALEEKLPAAVSRNHYRITLTGLADVNLKKLQEQFAYLPYLELKDRTEGHLDVWEDAKGDSLRGTYFSMLRRMTESEDADTAQAALLAAELSARILRGGWDPDL